MPSPRQVCAPWVRPFNAAEEIEMVQSSRWVTVAGGGVASERRLGRGRGTLLNKFCTLALYTFTIARVIRLMSGDM